MELFLATTDDIALELQNRQLPFVLLYEDKDSNALQHYKTNKPIDDLIGAYQMLFDALQYAGKQQPETVIQDMDASVELSEAPLMFILDELTRRTALNVIICLRYKDHIFYCFSAWLSKRVATNLISSAHLRLFNSLVMLFPPG